MTQREWDDLMDRLRRAVDWWIAINDPRTWQPGPRPEGETKEVHRA